MSWGFDIGLILGLIGGAGFISGLVLLWDAKRR